MTTIYVDNAATTKTSRTAIEAMLPYMDKIYGNPSSLHSVGQAAADALRKAREEAAEVLGCEPNEITFTSGGSEADNQALVSAAAIGARKGKKHIISTAFEHHAILHTLKKLEKEGFEVTLLDVHENGMVSAQQVADAIREDTCLVSVMYANNEIGSIQPIAEIGAVCKEKGVIFHTDAVQAVGHVHINVKEENIDMLSLSAHKFHGPKGVGLLYARKGVRLTNIIEGGAQERGKRAGTENIPGIVEKLKNFLEDMQWEGFANMDIKYDARTGEYKMFEMNPRQGRSSYFVTAAGYNLSKWLVEDVLEHKELGLTIADTKSLWMIAPYGVIKKYLKDPDLLARADKLKKEGKCAHQLFCKEDWNLKRWLWYIRSQLNYYRKTARYYGNKGLRD